METCQLSREPQELSSHAPQQGCGQREVSGFEKAGPRLQLLRGPGGGCTCAREAGSPASAVVAQAPGPPGLEGCEVAV
ncbi:hypothetical protein P7K49_018724 [Saguinus oedipus]|uniref:Uncharacterized protein n=1 Tax=Saguinus oedipus TaxID=9490 RepID=A0ABQ9V664_SAGOE|nr:hypothetical protein P7K49_018724 [Saguinus oedipus]